MTKVDTVAVLGTGVIGASWVSLFLAAGLKVRAFDPADTNGDCLCRYIDSAWLTALTRNLVNSRPMLYLPVATT